MGKFKSMPGTKLHELQKSDFELRPHSYRIPTKEGGINYQCMAIFYKGVPLWNCVSETLDEYEFYILDETYYPDGCGVTLLCVDNLGDLYSWGRWSNIEAAKNWCADPKILR
jgi:hypothetical protein